MFKPGRRDDAQATGHVSIPQSGFWVFKHAAGVGPVSDPLGFNPSVGILGVQARRDDGQATGQETFQSLSRDSGCSSAHVLAVGDRE